MSFSGPSLAYVEVGLEPSEIRRRHRM